MKLRIFPNPPVSVSEIGLGCWQLGGADWGNVDDEKAFAILRTAAEVGISFLDTADVYGAGRSEELIGRFLKESRETFFVATKLGRNGLYPDKYTEEGIRAATEASLRRLGTDCLDLSQLHCVPTSILKHGEIFDWLRKLRDEGKIHRFGASVESDEEGMLCLRQEGLSSLQVIFNVLRQKPAGDLFAEAARRNVGIIVRLPLASGVLSGKFTAKTTFASRDHRNYNQDGAAFNIGETFAGIRFGKAVSLAEQFRSFVPMGWDMASMAQRWILDHEAVSTVITGASKPEQVLRNAAVSELPPIDSAVHIKLRDFYNRSVACEIRGPY